MCYKGAVKTRFFSPAAIFFVCAATLCAQASVDELKKAVVEIGRLDFIRDVPVRYLDRAQMKSYIERLFDSDYPDELAAKESEFFYLMGFTAEKINLKSLRKKIILENVGGMYNEKTKELLAIEEYRNLDMINTPALAHELRHAVQDQHFHLAKLLGDYSDYDDRKLAVLAAVEGDATWVMIRQLGYDPDLIGEAFSPENVLAFSALTGATTLGDAPAIVKYQLLMPYLDGMRFSRDVFKKDKWKGLNQVLTQPIQSSEQILHPEKYFKRERPATVRIAFRPASWREIHSGVVGEYFLNVLLAEGPDVADAAAGWNGDAFAIFHNGASALLLWKAQWDTVPDCARFAAAFRSFLEKKFKLTFRPGQNKGQAFLAGNSAAGYFFLRESSATLFYARSNDRGQINEFINGGNYD
jgi:hypothetical protein